jgi:hypothetical protein
MHSQNSARRGRVQVLVVRQPGRPVDVLRVARRLEHVMLAVALVAVVVWVIAHLVQVALAVGLMGYVGKLAGRLVRF